MEHLFTDPMNAILDGFGLVFGYLPNNVPVCPCILGAIVQPITDTFCVQFGIGPQRVGMMRSAGEQALDSGMSVFAYLLLLLSIPKQITEVVVMQLFGITALVNDKLT